MTPETRAALSRARAFHDAWTGHYGARDQVIAQVKPGSADMLTSGDLGAILAALDALPDGVITCEHILTEEAADDLKRRFVAAQHDGTPARWLDEPERAACAICARPIQYLNHPGQPTGWMHILEAPDHGARPQDNPA